MNALFCALTKEEFNRVSTAISAHQIWHTLQVTHEGTNKVKESKISVLVYRFELFKMEENETISEMVTTFQNGGEFKHRGKQSKPYMSIQ